MRWNGTVKACVWESKQNVIQKGKKLKKLLPTLNQERKEINVQNHEIIAEFVEKTEPNINEAIDTQKGIIVRFLLGVRLQFEKFNGEFITNIELINIFISELRQCVIELEIGKTTLLEGTNIQ